MAEIIKRSKALSVSPLKSSAPIGAALAFLGMQRAIPMLHGSQGCTAFGKVFFVRHFREPIPLQTTAMDQVSTVMGAEENIVEGLRTICEKSGPALIGLPTTGLSETQGSDVNRAVKEFRKKYPQFGAIAVVPVSTPDYTGCLESGYAAAVKAMIETLVPRAKGRETRSRRVNVLACASLTPGDIEELKTLIEAFGLQAAVFPDISESLDGHLPEAEFSPLTLGGTSIDALKNCADAIATLVIGASLESAADVLRERTGVADFRFRSLIGLDAVDELITVLAALSDAPVPQRIERQRAQLQDAMVDTHFMLGAVRCAVATDPDLLYAYTMLLHGMGGEIVAAVSPIRADVLSSVPADKVQIGDLEDLETAARERKAQIVLGNSHAAESAHRLGVPLLRIGFPQYDLIGGYQRTWIGYRGTRQALFDLANLVTAHGAHEIRPYCSVYAQETKYAAQADRP